MNAAIDRQLQRRAVLGTAVVSLLALSACGESTGAPVRPRTALSPVIPPGPRQLTACFLHHDVTQDSTIDGITAGIDIQNATDQPDFGVGAPCLSTMLQSFVGDSVTPIPATPATDVLGCHTWLDDVYVIAGPGHADSLFQSSTPKELVEGTTQRVCQALSKLNNPDSISYQTSLKRVPGSFQRICDRRNAYVFAPSPEDELNLTMCDLLER